jgi:parallel beta-helix repeat protein
MFIALGETYNTIYIRSDGSIEPSNAPLSTTDKHYYRLTKDLLGSIIVEKSNVIINGGGHILTGRVAQGYTEDRGLVVQASNVIITDFKFQGFREALVILNTSNIEINKCVVNSNWRGIYISNSTNILIYNNTMEDNAPSIQIVNSTYIETSKNTIEGRGAGIIIKTSSNVYIHEDAIQSKTRGIIVDYSNMVYIGENKVVVIDDVGIDVENSLKTYIFNNSLDGKDGAGSCNIRIIDSKKTFIHKNLLQNAPVVVDVERSSEQIVVSYNYVISENPYGVPTIYLTNTSSIVVYGNNGETLREHMLIELNNSHEIVIQNNTNVVISGGTSSSLNICVNMRSAIKLDNVHSIYICGNLVDYRQFVVRGSNITIHGNTVRNYRYGGIGGVRVYGDFIKIYENVILNNDYGISFEGNHFEIYCNNITGNNVGILASGSSRDVVVYDNVIAFNGGSHEPFCGGPGTGVCIYGSDHHNITFYHNSFIKNYPNNEKQVYLTIAGYKWDNDYPSGGNYWSDYIGVDIKKGAKQDEPGSDGIGDSPYQVSLYPKEQDRYPLIKSARCSKRTQLILIPPPNISIEPPLIKISKPTPTPTSITSTINTISKTSPIKTTSLPTYTTTSTISTSITNKTIPPTTTIMTTTQVFTSIETITTTIQKTFDTIIIIVVSIIIVISTITISILRKRTK